MKTLLLLFIAFISINCQAQKNMKKRVEEMRQQYMSREYEKAYQLARNILKDDAKNLSALNCLMNSAYELKKPKEAVEASTKIISSIDQSTLFPYLEEHSYYRQLLREAYNLRAWIAYETGKDLPKALEDVNRALSITSPIDKDQNLNAYIDTRVRILLKLNRTKEAYATAEKALRKDPDIRDLQDIKSSEAYKKYVAEVHQSGWGKYTKGSSTETAIEALNRYENFIKLYEKDTEQPLPYHQLKWYKNKFSQKELQEVEKRLGITLPPDYIKFVTTYGNFSIQEGYNLLNPKEITRLSDALRKEWEINLDKKCTPKQRENLDNLICFGYGTEDQQDVWYYVFSYKTRNAQTGYMEVQPYNQDDWWDLTKTPERMYSDKRGGFDTYISELVDSLIQSIIEE
ncbi:SMI1/KNR4 family protein [Emticicia sp. C21]|uniref:SMI1/KNR4 family protein n=1 Tax=Emticicia sp. C21 TaxID=2302915 RepID=UPI00131491F6|nr:SMI1/KNR4 family protein [Emticicia sp. C21]